MPKTAQPSVADLRQQHRDGILDVTAYARALNDLIQYHAQAAAEYGHLDESSMLASDKRAWERHQAEFKAADAALIRLQMDNPDDPAFQVDRSQVVQATGADRWDGHQMVPAVGTGYHTGGGHTYHRGDYRTSWVRDLVAADLRGDRDAYDRLQRNNREVQTESRALSTAATAGGEWAPPLWLISQGLKLARAGRVIANQVTTLPLPPGVDSISLPRIATGTAVAQQVTENTTIQETDATTASITADITTIAGMQTLSLQLVDQSSVPVDEIVGQDLLAALAVETDTYVIANNAANKRGLLNVSGINAITYTDASPTVSELYPKLADAVQQVHTGRFLPPTRIFMHPRRWAWLTAATDTAGRPLVVPAAQMPQNVIAAMGEVASEGFVGSMLGIPVYVDANIPTNLGAGTNEDRIIVARAEDVILYEAVPRANMFREPLASQVSVLLVVHNYVAIHASRYPKSISVIAGTGLVTPTF